MTVKDLIIGVTLGAGAIVVMTFVIGVFCRKSLIHNEACKSEDDQ